MYDLPRIPNTANIRCTVMMAQQLTWKRLILSLMLSIVHDEATLTVAFSVHRQPLRTVDQFFAKKMLVSEHRYRHNFLLCSSFAWCSPRSKHSSICMNDLRSDDVTDDDQRIHRTKSNQDGTIARLTIATWTTQQLLAALDERRIRYAPISSRADLEFTFLNYLIVNNGYNTLDPPNNNRHENVTPSANHFNEGLVNDDAYSNHHDGNFDSSMPHKCIEERVQKRLQRRHQHQTHRNPIGKSMSNVLFSVAPLAAGNVVDYTKRKTRRWKQRITDYILLDDETGIRDVLRYDYVRSEQKNHVLSDIVLGPGDAIEVIAVDYRSTETRPTDANGRIKTTLDTSFQGERSSTENMQPSVKRLPPQSYESPTLYNSSISRLPPPLNEDQDTSAYFSSTNYRTVPKRKRRIQNSNQKKVFNPYGTVGRDINDGDKDVIDRVSDFVTKTAGQIFDRVLDTDGVPAAMDERSNFKTTTKTTARAASTSSPCSRRPNTDNSRRTHHKHWKDRLEERLDSMLGLHENGDFYRSWTERYEQQQNENVSSETNNAFSVAQGRKRPKQRGKPMYNKPFWEEDGNIFSLLFGRTQHVSRRPPRIQRPRWSGVDAGSILSILRFVIQNCVIIASYLCRWASTQGALPQPVVVLGVSSAMLCARPHRRLFSAGIALLLLRTVGEVLHGYVYGSSGWEENDVDTDDTNVDVIEQYDDNSGKDDDTY